MEYVARNEKETYKLAQKLAKKIKPGGVLALSGDLGSGKTTFTKGFAKALGINKPITSPTFVLLKIYRIINPEAAARKLVHVDCYRMENEQDARSIGLEEYFADKDSIIVIEWPEKIAEILPPRALWIRFRHLGDTAREITIDDVPLY